MDGLKPGLGRAKGFLIQGLNHFFDLFWKAYILNAGCYLEKPVAFRIPYTIRYSGCWLWLMIDSQKVMLKITIQIYRSTKIRHGFRYKFMISPWYPYKIVSHESHMILLL